MKKIFILLIVSVLAYTTHAIAADVQTIDIDELKQQLGSADLVILDVRAGSDWDSSDFKIQGALRADPSDVQTWAGNFSPDKTYVLYCA